VRSAAGTVTPENEPEPFDPFFFFQNYLHSLMDGGANIQVLLDDAGVSLGPGLGLGRDGGASFGDYFVGRASSNSSSSSPRTTPTSTAHRRSPSRPFPHSLISS
jgi:hypothetical protein